MENEPQKIEQHEQIVNENPITVYYLRHGESSEDKNDPLRGLTDKGREQVRGAIRRAAGEIKDKNSQIRLYSSGSERTRQQCIVAAEILKEAGFADITIDNNSLPKKEATFTSDGVKFERILDEKDKEEAQRKLAETMGLAVEGYGVAKRIAELKASKDYKNQIRALEKETGTPAVIHWLMDRNLPEGTESAPQKAEVVTKAIEITNRWAQHMKQKNEQPIVAFAFGHSSALTSFGLKTFGMEDEPERIKAFGEVENAEGLKVSFSGEVGSKPEIKPFGQTIEQRASQKE